MKVAVTRFTAGACLAASLLAAEWAAGNTGPFLVRYPNGDPAAKGVLARAGSEPKTGAGTAAPGGERGFDDQVFTPARFGGAPAVFVQAGYTIENPADRQVEADFGFPILRGIFIGQRMSVEVNVDGVHNRVRWDIIPNSLIYGLVRQQARAAIEKGILADKELGDLVGAVRKTLGRPAPDYARPQRVEILPGRPAEVEPVRRGPDGRVRWSRPCP